MPIPVGWACPLPHFLLFFSSLLLLLAVMWRLHMFRRKSQARILCIY